MELRKTSSGNAAWWLLLLWVVVALFVYWFFLSKKDAPVPSNQPSEPKPSIEEGVSIGGKVTEPKKSVFDNLSQSKDHSTFLTAMQTTGLVSSFQSRQTVTVFAPTNTAFGKLSRDSLQALFNSDNKNELQELLNVHIVPGKYRTADFQEGMKLKTVQGKELVVTQKAGKWWINNTSIIEVADILSANGVVHSIDAVLSASSE